MDIVGAWGAQAVKRLTSAQVMISVFLSSSLMSGSVLTAPSLDPIPDAVSPFLFPSSTHFFSLSLFLSKKKKPLKKDIIINIT